MSTGAVPMMPPSPMFSLSNHIPMETGTEITSVPKWDPVKLLSPVMIFYLPLGFQETNTMIGFWFTTTGILNIYILQAIFPDNIYTQIKVITIRIPVALGLLVFSLGLGMFLVRSLIVAVRAATEETVTDIQQMLDKVMKKIRNKKPLVNRNRGGC